MIKYGIQLSLIALLLFGCASSSSNLDAGSQSDGDSNTITAVESSSSESASTDVASTSVETTSTTANGAIAPLDDTTVIPGEKFGAVTVDTSRQDLEALYGADVLSDKRVDVGEGMTEAATRVELGDGYSFTVVWSDSSRTSPLEIRDIGSAWTMPEGIQIGTSFSELQSSLGEFELFGFGWDYGGTLMLDNTPLDAYKDTLIMRLQPENQAQTSNPTAMDAVMGDELYKSDNPNFESLNMTVSEIIVVLGSYPG